MNLAHFALKLGNLLNDWVDNLGTRTGIAIDRRYSFVTDDRFLTPPVRDRISGVTHLPHCLTQRKIVMQPRFWTLPIISIVITLCLILDS